MRPRLRAVRDPANDGDKAASIVCYLRPASSSRRSWRRRPIRIRGRRYPVSANSVSSPSLFTPRAAIAARSLSARMLAIHSGPARATRISIRFGATISSMPMPAIVMERLFAPATTSMSLPAKERCPRDAEAEAQSGWRAVRRRYPDADCGAAGLPTASRLSTCRGSTTTM